MGRAMRWLAPLLAVALFVWVAGCGTDLSSVLYQSATAAGQTILDQFFTDVANNVADAVDREDGDDADEGDADEGDDDADGDEGDGGTTEPPSFDDLTGDPAAGEPLYASCAACHGEDPTAGGIPIAGVDAETLDEYLRGDAPHLSAELTDQEIVDLEAYLASFGP